MLGRAVRWPTLVVAKVGIWPTLVGWWPRLVGWWPRLAGGWPRRLAGGWPRLAEVGGQGWPRLVGGQGWWAGVTRHHRCGGVDVVWPGQGWQACPRNPAVAMVCDKVLLPRFARFVEVCKGLLRMQWFVLQKGLFAAEVCRSRKVCCKDLRKLPQGLQLVSLSS